MGNINQDYIEDYIHGLIVEEDSNFLSMREYAEVHNIPIIESETAEFLKFLVSVKEPENILELGTAIGYSTLLLAKYSSERSQITTVELSEKMVFLAKENIKKSPYSDKINVIKDDAANFLEETKDNFDFIFIDAAKGQYEKYFNFAIEQLSPKGIIIFDNVLFKGMIASDELVIRRKKTIVKRLRSFLPKIMADDNFITSLLPLGDGVFLLRRREDEKN